MLSQRAALVGIALLGVDEAVSETLQFRCWATGVIVAFPALVSFASRMANDYIAAVNCAGVDAYDRTVAHHSVAAVLQFLSGIDHCVSVTKDDDKESPR